MSFGTALCKFLSLYQSVMNGTCEQVHQLWYLYLHFVTLNLYLGICIFFQPRSAWLRCRIRTLLQIHVTPALAPAGGEIAPPSSPPGRACRVSFDGWAGKGSEFTALWNQATRLSGAQEAADRVGRPAAPFLLLPPLLRSWLLDDGSSGGGGRRRRTARA